MLKVTFEFQTVEEAIAALAKVGGIGPVASTEKSARKGRADKGQTREPYKPRAQGQQADPSVEAGTAASTTAQAASITPKVGSGGGQGAEGGVTESGSATSAGPSTVPSTAPAPVAPSPADAVKAEIQAQQAAHGTGFEGPIGDKDADVQKAVEKLAGAKGIDAVRTLLADFGVKRVREVPKVKREEFLKVAAERS